MGLEDAANDVPIPFVGESLDFTQPGQALMVVVALIAGATVWNMTDKIGASAANRLVSWIAEATNMNVGGSDPGTTFGGN